MCWNNIPFEFYATKSGTLRFEIRSISLCGTTELCSDYIENGGVFQAHTFSTRYTKTVSFVVGYNKILLGTRVNVQKGWLICIPSLSGELVSTRKKYMDLYQYVYTYNDGFSSSSNTYYGSGYAIMMNTISEKMYYQGFTNFEYQYDYTGTYTITVKLKNYVLNSKSVSVRAIKSKFY